MASRGFSLIELVVTVLLLGIIAAIALPGFNDRQVQATWLAEEIRAAVRYAQKQAVSQRRQVFVLASATRLQVCYSAAVDGGGTCTAPVLALTSGAAYAVAIPSGLSLGAAPATFSFNGLGQPSSAATLTVLGHTVTVAAETGYVL